MGEVQSNCSSAHSAADLITLRGEVSCAASSRNRTIARISYFSKAPERLCASKITGIVSVKFNQQFAVLYRPPTPLNRGLLPPEHVSADPE